MTLSKKRANISRIKKVIEWLKLHKSAGFGKEDSEIIANYESLYLSDIGVLEVKSVRKKNKQKVYDVSVEKTESFFGNDYPILLHNSGSKGFHIIISGIAFPKIYDGIETKKMFPEWPRAISEYLMSYIKSDYNREASAILTNFEAIQKRTNVTKEELQETICLHCGKPAQKGELFIFECPVCGLEIQRKNFKMTKRRLRCLSEGCAGVLETKETIEYFWCENCKDPDNEKIALSSDKYPEMFEKTKGVSAAKVASLDLVLVAPRHLFRMPYSLHEKTSLSSVVLKKEDLDNFSPKNASAMKIQVLDFYPKNEENEGKNLLAAALEWKKNQNADEEKMDKKRYSSSESYAEVDYSKVKEEMFPIPIKKLLKGLKDGRKRGLFVLITFLRSLGFSGDYINSRTREWNKLNEVPLKEGYVKSQIDWHLKQKKKIMPPNYDNQNFYQDLGLLDKKPDSKNPLVEVMRTLRKMQQ